MFCAGDGGFLNPIQDFILDTASPYNGAWQRLTPSHVGSPYQHVTATPNATARQLSPAGPVSLSAFWTDAGGDVWTEDQTDGRWGTYQAIGGPLSAVGKSVAALAWAPVASSWVDSTGTPAQIVFWVGQDGSVWQNVRTSAWGAPRQLAGPGSAAGPIDATAKVATHADVVWVTPSGGLMGAWWDAGANSTYTFAPGPLPHVSSGASTHGAISILLQAAGDLSVFWITSSGAVMQMVNDAASNTWLTPVVVATTAAIDSGLAAVTTDSLGGGSATGRQHLAWVGLEGAVHLACNDVGWECYGAPAGHWGTQDLRGAGPGSAVRDPIALYSGGPFAADLFWVNPRGDLMHGTWNGNNADSPAAWSISPNPVAAVACNTCGEQGANPCHGNNLSCPQGTSSMNGLYCSACGLYTEQPCNDGTGNLVTCTQFGTQLGTNPQTAQPGCVCDPKAYPTDVTTTQFNVFLSPGLDEITLSVSNDQLTVSIPDGVHFPGGGKSTLSVPAGNAINSLSIPGDTLGVTNAPMLWQLDQYAPQIDVTTTLSANITAYYNGVNGIGSCSATVDIENAPLAITLVPAGNGTELQASSVNLGATDSVNMGIEGCTVIAGDVEGQVMDQIQQQLKDRLNSMLAGSHVLSSMMTALANTPYPTSSSSTVEISQLPTPAPPSAPYSWACTATGLDVGTGVGRITGSCSRVCAKPWEP
jgi:hypothetical protein